MTTVVTRAVKGSPLTYAEMDANFNNLNTDKLEAGTPGTNIANTPAGTIAATTVQAAINELDTDKLATTATALNGTTIPASKTLVVTTDIGSTVQAYNANTIAVAPGTSANVLTSNGSAWTSAASVSGMVAGTIIDYAGSTAPTGYLLCPTALPAAISATTYKELALAIGGTWGAGTTTVNAGSFVATNTYVIKTVGTTDFTLIGATSNTVGLAFTATGIGAGSGSAYSDFVIPWFAANYAAVQANANVGTASVGVVLAHTHSIDNVGAASSLASGGALNNAVSTGTTYNQNPAGGTANLAAGVRILKCVKY